MVGALGIEPRLKESKSFVLPLDDAPRMASRKGLEPLAY